MRPKWGKDKYWTQEEKLRIINRVLDAGMSARQVAVQEYIKDIVYDNNYYSPSYTLKYKTPIEYRTQLGFS